MAKKTVIYLAYLVLTLSVYPKDSPAMSSRPTRPITYPIRVAVIKDAGGIELDIRGHYRIYTLPLVEILKEGGDLRNAAIKPTYSGILMEGEPLKIYGINIKTDNFTDICVNGRKFRGEIDIIRTENLKLLVINHLDIEDYVSGVLYHEVSHWWPMEAIKAQAIATRTFAIYKSIESRDKDYDVGSDIYTQVYGGKTSEKIRTNKAVELTLGKVLVYNQEILPAYFHATCGGHTEDAAILWKTDIAPLKGRPCRYCEKSPHSEWTEEIPLDSIQQLLNKGGYKIKDIRDIRTSERDISGRLKTVSVIDSLGEEKIPANKFRLTVGPNVIRSANFTVRAKGDSVIFSGKGWGHGVGMCQWGAYYMAKMGTKAEDILRFYYPGAKIVDLKDVMK